MTREASDPPNDVDILQRSEFGPISRLVAQTPTSVVGLEADITKPGSLVRFVPISEVAVAR